MERNYIQNETAVLAFEAGCRIEGHLLYDVPTDTTYNNFIKKGTLDNYEGKLVFILEQSVLQKWLREEHNLIVLPDYIDEMCWTYKLIYGGYKEREECYFSYEEALEFGLKSALELLIELKEDAKRKNTR